MAITNIDNLKTAVRDWLVGHLISDNVLDTFLDLAEADFNRTLRVRSMLVRTTATISNQYMTLPADWLAAQNVSVAERPLRVITMDHADLNRMRTAGGVACFYVISNMQIEFVPAPTGSLVELVYYAKIPALTSVNPTNWLLSRSPDLYFCGVMAAAATYIADTAKAAIWATTAQAIKLEMHKESENASFGSSPLVMRSAR